MNREQMIAWLTLEGWIPVICGTSVYAKKPMSKTFSRKGSTYSRSPYGDTSNIDVAHDAGWGVWGDNELAQLVRAEDADARG